MLTPTRFNLTVSAILLTSILVGGCTSKPPTALTPQPDTWTAGPWVFSPARFPDRLQEYVFTPFTETHTDYTWPRRGPRQRPHLDVRSSTRPTGDFKLKPAEGGSSVFSGTYRKQGDRFVREDAAKDYYRGLVFVWRGQWFSVAESDQPRIKVYSGSTLVPLSEPPLFAALRRGDRAFVAASPDLVSQTMNDRDQLGRTLLYRAAQLNDRETLALLLSKGVPADLHNAPPLQRTAMAAAIRLSRLDVIDQLLAAGANPNEPDANGARPLHIAGEGCGEYRKIVRRLLAAGADPSLTNRAGETPRQRLERAHASGFLPILNQEITAASAAK